jgi:phosphoribosylamine-glycine ligase
MMNLKDKTVCVCDFGNYIMIARRLSKDFGRTLYFAPSDINGFREHNAFDIGRGVEGIERIHDLEEYEDEVDIFVFPDLYMIGKQESLRRRGKLVFGSGRGQMMETNRGYMKRLQKELGLPLNGYEEVTGVYALEERLKVLEDKYVKSSLRGDNETFHHTNYILSKEELKGMKHRMGIFDKKETYIIEDPIESIAEIGIDTFSCDGMFLNESLTGIELKDVGYYGRMVKYNRLPKQLKEVTDKLSDTFNLYNYRGPYSNEIRIDANKTGYLIDATCRFPQPPTSLMTLIYDNFSEVVWEVASGRIPKVEYSNEHGVQFIIKSELAQTEAVAVQFDKKYLDNIDIKNLVVDDDGTYYYTPNNISMKEIGSVSATGKTMEQAVRLATKIAESVKGFDIKINTDCISDAKKQMDTLNKNGINYL